MSARLWNEVAQRSEASRRGTQIERGRERVRRTAEVFTPTELVIDLLQQLPIDSFGPGKKVLDPACGDGQFLAAVKFAKMLIWNQSEASALADLFGVDILLENVMLCRKRLGGGTIVVGDALNPDRVVDGQTDADRAKLQQLLGVERLTLF